MIREQIKNEVYSSLTDAFTAAYNRNLGTQ
jgi:hypothetical protein